MKNLKIKPRKKKKFKGFGDSAKQQARHGWRYVALELNKETWESPEGFPDLYNSEILDLLEIHHLGIAPVLSNVDQLLIQTWSEQIADCYISPAEFLAEIYTTHINAYALSIGANVGRIYHNSCLGDTRIHGNSIGHIFEPSDFTLPAPVVEMLDKYVALEHLAKGDNVTLKNRLGL